MKKKIACPECEQWLTLQRTTCPHFVKPVRVRYHSGFHLQETNTGAVAGVGPGMLVARRAIKNVMKRDEITRLFQSLARSQGLYGRILRNIDNLSESDREEFWIELEAQNFADDIDVILFIEG